jgi:hypothetical protein
MKFLKFFWIFILFSFISFSQTFEEEIKKFEKLKVRGTTEWKDKELKIGDMDLKFSGKVEEVVAENYTVGFLFEGGGNFTLNLKDKYALVGIKTNLKEQGSYELNEKNQIIDEFTEAFILVYPFLSAEIFGKGEERESEKINDYIKILEKQRYPSFEFYFLPAIYNNYKNQMALCFLKGKKEKNLLFVVDGNEENMEYLMTYKPSRWQSGLLDTNLLVFHPYLFDWTKRKIYPVYITNLDIEVLSKDNLNLKEKAKIEFTPLKDGISVMTLSLTNGTSKEEWLKKWNERSNPFNCKKITNDKGEDISFIHKYDTILLRLKEPTKKEKPFNLTFESEGPILKNFNGDSYFILGNMVWYPTLSLYATQAKIHFIAKVKEPWKPINCGKTIKEWKEEDLNCLESSSEEPVSFPFIIVGEFKTQEFKEGNYLVRVHSYAQLKESGGKKLGKNGIAILDFYSNGLVPFAYDELDVVEIPYFRHFFWQSPAGIVEITSEGLNPIGTGDEDDIDTLLRRWVSLGVNARYAHEIGHQWFGNLVSWASDVDGWLSESFAEYLSYLFMESTDKKKAKEQFNGWVVSQKELKERGSIFTAPYLDTTYPDSIYHYYNKGPLLLHNLRKELGDQIFFTILKKFAEQCQKKRLKATTEDFIQFVNFFSKKDFRPFFEKYFYGSDPLPVEK